MQVGSVSSAAYTMMTQGTSNQVSASVSQAADAATQAMYSLSTAVGGASEAIMNIAAGSMDSAVDIQV